MVHRFYDKKQNAEDRSPFRCQGFQRDAHIPCANGVKLPIQELPPFLRALLVTDGTVTKILEAYFWEPVEVVTLQQELVHAERPIEWIQVTLGDPVLVRSAHLVGADSGRLYATASSIIRPQLVPEVFRQRLIDREIGIGVLIRDSGLESYREVLEVGVGPADGRDQESALDQSGLIFRTYRIIIDGAPVILITESFPFELYRCRESSDG